MVAAVSTSTVASDPREDRLYVPNVPWATYVMLRDSLDEQRSQLRLTYREGELELMSPSEDHEETKSLIGRLLEAYGDAMRLDLRARGSTTFRAEAKKRGLEPDECYSLGQKRDVPDLAIEVVYSTPKIDKLDVYCGLGVPEVWIWEAGALRAYVLAGDRYEETRQSKVLPKLDLALFASFVRLGENQMELVESFRAAIGVARR